MCSCSVNYTHVVKSTNSIFRRSCDRRRIPSRGHLPRSGALSTQYLCGYRENSWESAAARARYGLTKARPSTGSSAGVRSRQRAVWHTRVCGRHCHGDSGKESRDTDHVGQRSVSTINVLIDGGPELSVTAQVRKPEEHINTDAKDNCNGCKGPECAFRSHGSDLHRQRAS
jgi:hypothetical protein